MKYRLPENCGGVSHAGRTLDVGPGACIETTDDDAVLLAPHGIAPLPSPARLEPRAIDTMARAALVAALADRGIAAPGAGFKMLRSLLRQAAADPKRRGPDACRPMI